MLTLRDLVRAYRMQRRLQVLLRRGQRYAGKLDAVRKEVLAMQDDHSKQVAAQQHQTDQGWSAS